MYFIGQTGGPDETPPVVVSALRETGTTTDTIVALPDPASGGTPYSDIGAPHALAPYMQLLENPPLLWSWGGGWHASSMQGVCHAGMEIARLAGLHFAGSQPGVWSVAAGAIGAGDAEAGLKAATSAVGIVVGLWQDSGSARTGWRVRLGAKAYREQRT